MKHQQKGDSDCKTCPLHGSDAPCTAMQLQDSRTAGSGVPVAQLPAKTISVDGKRGALGCASKPDGSISAVLTEQLSPSRQQGHAQQHKGRDTMFRHVLRFLTFASPGKPRHSTNRGRRKEATGKFIPICPQANRRMLSGQSRCAT